MRIVFMGTPDIAAHALAALLAEGHKVAAVYTRPDKPQGRKQVLTPSPVKRLALENGLPVRQPRTLRAPGEAAALAALGADLAVVVAYGLILPPEVLAAPRLGCINLHVSLLPKYRGAAPIQWAIINGERETGVSVMQLDAGVDTGPVLAQQKVAIGPNDAACEVFSLVTPVGARLLAQTVAGIEAGRAQAVPQTGPHSLAPQLDKHMAALDFTRPAQELHNLARGCYPWPVAWFTHGGKKIKVERTQVASGQGAYAGEVLQTSPLTVACGQGSLVLRQVLPEGSRSMSGVQWAAGRRLKAGESLC